MTHTAELLVLSSTKIGEKSLVIHCLTKQWGRRSFLYSVTKGSPTALLMPMNLLEGEVSENPKSELWRIRNLNATHPLSHIRNDLHRNTMTMFMSEVLYRTVRDGASEAGLYEWCRTAMATLDSMQTDYANFHLRFLLELAAMLGFSPAGGNIDAFAGERLAEIRALMSPGLAESMLVPLDGKRRSEIAEVLLEYIGHCTDCRLDIHSLSVLKEIYR